MREPEASPRYDAPVYLISTAARLAGMHAQTLRSYDRLGLVVPRRTSGRGRRYSQRDVDKLAEIQRLSQDEGINLAGISRILALVEENEALRSELEDLAGLAHERPRVFSASASGDIVATTRQAAARRRTHARALVLWTGGRG